jgi:predicted nucleic acid-binding Zn ribbon protein
MKKVDYKERANKTICLEDELEDYVKHIGLDDKMQELKILNVWNECVGDSIAKVSRPAGINRNKLFVSVENAAWRYELSARKKEIIDRVNNILKAKLIKDIIFI